MSKSLKYSNALLGLIKLNFETGKRKESLD